MKKVYPMKANNLFSVLSFISICGIVYCTIENHQIFSVEHIDKVNWKHNFTIEDQDSTKYILGIKEFNVLVQKIQDVYCAIQKVKSNKNIYTLDEDLRKTMTEFKDISYQCYKYPEYIKDFNTFDEPINLINRFLELFKKKQDENPNTALLKSIKKVVYKLQDLNALAKVVEKLFNEEIGMSEASYYNNRIREEFEKLHYNIKLLFHHNQTYSDLLGKIPQYFNVNKKKSLYVIISMLGSFKGMAKSMNREIFFNQAIARHEANYKLSCEYLSYFSDIKRNLELIISTLYEIITCNTYIYKYLRLLEKSLTEN